MSVRLRGVSRRYPGLTALDSIDLTIADGESVALMGPSGAGKSTILHLIGGMDAPDGGTLEVDGRALDRRHLDDHRRRIGFVFQRYHLLPALTLLDNVMVPVLPRRVDFDRRARAHELLGAVGLDHRAQALPSELSGGQQQRVAIARALINHPHLLLADEPTGNLDSATGREILDLLLRLRGEFSMTLIVATHDVEVASACDRIVRVEDGRIVADDRVAPAADALQRLGGLRP
jgi:putative ABC transport system ATP-binding protein